ncbi:carbohydrate kinase family protein [Protaetiibacter mangrovi]|uniref:PfkB family carbohydrate kinase n=1 Tax=Protaetiibacter mangrovi TaxID=2970926 RepID=A0ABT1ZGC2_9MICO|nr:PfkB family carbohydrate kinase [Protaetiibacter mangrovi]MCS0499772.1 PfkB family carbohydrate kinase [Protaetiibacter mangrovi]
MTGSRIVVVGDVINDIVVVPRVPMRPDTDTPATIRPRPGGSAANTAVWLGSRHAPVDFVGAVGAHDADVHEREFRESEVEPHLQVEDAIPTGSIIIVVDGEERSMFVERGANGALRIESVTDELLDDAAVLHVSGYSILDGFGATRTRDLIAHATARGVPVSVNPASIGYIADFGVEAFNGAIEGATLLFPNRAEARLLTGEDDPIAAARVLGARFPVVALTLGGDGVLVVVDGGEAVQVPAPAVRLVDPTGAGDAFAAGFLESWVQHHDPIAAAETGVFVAACAVTQIGGRPAF